MTNILTSLQGKRTYIVAFILAALALAQAFGWSEPAWVDRILEALGLTTLRAAVGNNTPSTP